MKVKSVDVVVLIITASVSLVMLSSAFGITWRTTPASPSAVAAIEAVTQSYIAIVSLYVGSKIRSDS